MTAIARAAPPRPIPPGVAERLSAIAEKWRLRAERAAGACTTPPPAEAASGHHSGTAGHQEGTAA